MCLTQLLDWLASRKWLCHIRWERPFEHPLDPPLHQPSQQQSLWD